MKKQKNKDVGRNIQKDGRNISGKNFLGWNFPGENLPGGGGGGV